MKKIISLIVVMCLLLAITPAFAVFADNSEDKVEDVIVLTANEEQLKILNSLDIDNMTMDEVLSTVFPKEYKKVSKKLQKEFKKNKLLTKNIMKQEEAMKSSFTASRALDWGSNISMSQGMINHKSWNNHGAPEQWVETYLMKEGSSSYYGYNIAMTSNYATYFSTSNLEMPTTGNYKTHGRHKWMVYETSIGEYVWPLNMLVSNTLYISYVNQ